MSKPWKQVDSWYMTNGSHNITKVIVQESARFEIWRLPITQKHWTANRNKPIIICTLIYGDDKNENKKQNALNTAMSMVEKDLKELEGIFND